MLITVIFINIANLLTSGMNNAVHPCNNFYDYVCDKWPENNQIPEGYELWNTHQVTRSNVISTIRGKLKYYLFLPPEFPISILFTLPNCFPL